MKENEALGWRESLWTGAQAGLVQTLVSLPFWTMKTRIQCGFPFSCHPKTLYTGFFPASVSISLMSMSQVFFTTAVHGLLQNTIKEGSHGKDSEFGERCVSTLLGGAGATLVSNPVGVVITQQHKHASANMGFFSSAYRLYNSKGLKPFYVSAKCNYLINTAFTFSFYAAYPVFKGTALSYCPNEFYATVMASFGIGLLTGILLQAPDTVKVLQEKNADVGRFSVKSCVKEILKTKGPQGFYAGFWAASASTASAVAAAAVLIEQAENRSNYDK